MIRVEWQQILQTGGAVASLDLSRKNRYCCRASSGTPVEHNYVGSVAQHLRRSPHGQCDRYSIYDRGKFQRLHVGHWKIMHQYEVELIFYDMQVIVQVISVLTQIGIERVLTIIASTERNPVQVSQCA